MIRGGPAWEAGLKVGDVIVKIGGRPIKGLSLDEAANRLQGTEGTTVELEVRRRDGVDQYFRLVRRHVDVESVTKVKLVDPVDGIGYLQLTGFQKTSTEELDQAIGELSRQGMKALVLDFRGNPGGLLNVAVEIAERFIDSGLIVSTRGRAQGQTQVLSANGQAKWRMPIYVLVDHDSASASEILAGALQDHHRATILGSRTYGKGSVQSIFSLRSAPAGLKLTTAKFYSPSEPPLQRAGRAAGHSDHGANRRQAGRRRRLLGARGTHVRRPGGRRHSRRGDPHGQEPIAHGTLRRVAQDVEPVAELARVPEAGLRGLATSAPGNTASAVRLRRVASRRMGSLADHEDDKRSRHVPPPSAFFLCRRSGRRRLGRCGRQINAVRLWIQRQRFRAHLRLDGPRDFVLPGRFLSVHAQCERAAREVFRKKATLAFVGRPPAIPRRTGRYG